MAGTFGTTSKGEAAQLYEIRNASGMCACITDYGANLVKLFVPDREGKLTDVVLGYEDASGYEEGTCFIGAVVGRVANRIGGASFELNGKTYTLTDNDQGNTLHSGRDFTNQRMWEVEKLAEDSITLKLHSPEGDQGYPGSVDLFVTYSVTEDNSLSIHYTGTPTEDTLLNLTNHSYFNLAGHEAESVLSQKVMIQAESYARADASSIPTGELVPVEGTPMDFRKAHKIGDEIEADFEQLRITGGYDHNYVTDGYNKASIREIAEAWSEKTGIQMNVLTDCPCVQFYAANFVDQEHGKNGHVYNKREAFCLETQVEPNAVNVENFHSPILEAGERYYSETIYRFSVKK